MTLPSQIERTSHFHKIGSKSPSFRKGQRLRRGRCAVVENVVGAVADPVCQVAVTGSDRATRNSFIRI
jgi:hypothetical protein